MANDCLTAYWIERDSGLLRSQRMGPNDLRGHGDYVSEVYLKYANKPLERPVLIFDSRAGNDWERGEMDRLRAKAEEHRKALAVEGGANV